MGQPITVVEKASSNPAIIRFETNRPLTGLGHERYTEPPGELLDRPVDELARRLFAHGGVHAVHVNSSVVTVTLGGGSTGAGLADVIRRLFLHYTDTDSPAVPATPTPVADEGSQAPESAADPGDTVAAEVAEEPAARPPAAPEAATTPDAATTEPGAAPSQVEPDEQARRPEDDTSLAPPLDPSPVEPAAPAEPAEPTEPASGGDAAEPADS
jgi:hypothetical protein